MEIKPKQKGWKEGVLTKDLINGYGEKFKKGQVIRYKRYKATGDDRRLGEYEWHYTDQSNRGLIRAHELYIKE
jgi:hypothetical protein